MAVDKMTVEEMTCCRTFFEEIGVVSFRLEFFLQKQTCNWHLQFFSHSKLCNGCRDNHQNDHWPNDTRPNTTNTANFSQAVCQRLVRETWQIWLNVNWQFVFWQIVMAPCKLCHKCLSVRPPRNPNESNPYSARPSLKMFDYT